MEWALAIAIAWAILAMPVGYLLGRRMLRADQRAEVARTPVPQAPPPPRAGKPTTAAELSDVSGAVKPGS